MTRLPRLAATALAIGAGAGCVDRRYVIETNPPGAQIAVDGKPIGPSPVDSTFTYAGERVITATHPGYEPLNQRVNFRPKWYMYPPLDFFAEVLYPGRIEDIRRVNLAMQPAKPVSDLDLLRRGGDLRDRGRALPPPSVPNESPLNARVVPTPRAAPPVAGLPTNPLGGPQPNPAAQSDATLTPADPQVPATSLPPLANPRDGDTPGGVLRPPQGQNQPN